MKKFLAILSLSFAGIAQGSVLGIDLLGTPADWGKSSSSSFTLGYEFSISGTQEVDGLGFWDAGDGFNKTRVGLWDTSGNLLGSVNTATSSVTSTATHIGHGTWNFMDFNTTLSAGSYIVGAYASSIDYTWNGSLQENNLIYVKDRYSNDSSFTFPDHSSNRNAHSAGWFGANVRFAEPVSANAPTAGSLLAIAGFGMFLRRRRSHA